jgi:hypothetical protein
VHRFAGERGFKAKGNCVDVYAVKNVFSMISLVHPTLDWTLLHPIDHRLKQRLKAK